MAHHTETRQTRSGQCSGGVGNPTNHPANPFVSSQQCCHVEYAHYLMATRAGVDISPSFLLEEEPRAHFMTTRSDRDGNRRIHMRTLCAIDHLDFNLAPN